MAGWNLAQHYNYIYENLALSDENMITRAYLKTMLNRAEDKVNQSAKTIEDTFTEDSADATGSLMATNDLYDIIPTNSITWGIYKLLYSITDSTERYELLPSDEDKLYDFYGETWREKEGNPTHWYYDRRQKKVGVCPFETTVSDGSDCIEGHYYKKHTKMDNYYTTGTIGISGTAVTGSSTAWSSTTVAAGDKLGVGKLLDDDTDFPVTWYTILTVDSTTGITLTSTAGTIAASTSYIIASPSTIDDEYLNEVTCLMVMSKARRNIFKDTQSAREFEDEAGALLGTRITDLEQNTASGTEPIFVKPWSI